MWYWVLCKLSGHVPADVAMFGNGKWTVVEVACARCGVQLEDRAIRKVA